MGRENGLFSKHTAKATKEWLKKHIKVLEWPSQSTLGIKNNNTNITIYYLFVCLSAEV